MGIWRCRKQAVGRVSGGAGGKQWVSGGAGGKQWVSGIAGGKQCRSGSRIFE